MIKQTFLVVLAIISFLTVLGQQQRTTNFYGQIKDYDLSTVLTADSILAEDREEGQEKLKRPGILGYIGPDFQRFQIHFTSITKSKENPYRYLASGKTMVKGNICSFKGTFTIKQAGLLKLTEIPNIKQGFATCDVVLYEDQKLFSSGMIKGKLETNFLIDRKGKFRYDAIMLVADGFTNNEFVGSWTSYKTKISKKCNWGDYRIPESKMLDIGAGEFSVAPKYRKNGWENYYLATSTYPETLESKKAKQKEELAWWK